MIQYNLNILSVDGETIYAIISKNKSSIRNFLKEYDHEGSTLYLTRHEGEDYVAINNYENIYKELSE